MVNSLVTAASEAIGQTTLPVTEHFYTLQGEGAWSGHAAYFIRLGGCDVGCHWCDVKESWPLDAHPQYELEEMTAWPKAEGAPLVVVTGGEPMMHDLAELTAELGRQGLRRHLETSGAHPLSGQWDWITLSPKKFKPCLDEWYAAAHELKVVIFHPSDLAWAEGHSARVRPACKLYLQAEWDRREKITPLLIDYVKANPRWALSLQTHKWIGVP